MSSLDLRRIVHAKIPFICLLVRKISLIFDWKGEFFLV